MATTDVSVGPALSLSGGGGVDDEWKAEVKAMFAQMGTITSLCKEVVMLKTKNTTLGASVKGKGIKGKADKAEVGFDKDLEVSMNPGNDTFVEIKDKGLPKPEFTKSSSSTPTELKLSSITTETITTTHPATWSSYLTLATKKTGTKAGPRREPSGRIPPSGQF
jgi:hypothetical protein